MHPALKKLQYKGQDPILVVAAPPGYAPFLEGLDCRVHKTPKGTYGFIQVFARTAAELRSRLQPAIRALAGDGIFWICYPNKTSKNYASDLSRESIWEMVKAHGFEGVAMVAIDDDWSAFRVRRAALVGKGRKD
jgi:hypothetical protein